MTRDLEIRQCRVLAAVSDHGGIGAAALALGLAQSTVSETLLSLERLIGAPLLLRQRGKEAALTSAARTLLPHARALISMAETALAAVSMECRRMISIGAVESVSSFLLPSALSAFRSRWPFAEIQITVGTCDELRKRVLRGDLDAALTLDEGLGDHHKGTCCRTLARTQLCLIIASQSTTGTEEVSKATLMRRTFLLPDPDGPLPVLLRNWCGNSMIQPRFESAGSIDGVKNGVYCNDVVGVLPTYAVAKELKSGSLFELKVREPLPPIALGLTIQLWPSTASPLHDLIDEIENALNGSELLQHEHRAD
jgi:DNA-binding transcriptional LysR family regulator